VAHDLTGGANVTQLHLHPYRPENGELRAMRKLARNFRAVYHQYQDINELAKASTEGRWVAVESRMPGAVSVRDAAWSQIMDEKYARGGGLHIVTGSMNHGLPADVLDMMDYNVYVPQFDDVPFLSPVTAAGITLYEVFMATANKSGVLG
jgi:hypothetical protein